MRMSLVNVEQCCGFACERGSLLRQADDDADTKSVPLSRLAQTGPLRQQRQFHSHSLAPNGLTMDTA